MDIDINTLRGLGTLLVLIAFVGVVVWAWSSKRVERFREAADLPFADMDADRDAETNPTQPQGAGHE